MSDQTESTAHAGPQQIYEAFLAEGRFMIQRSRSTGEYVFYPKVMAPSGAVDLDWVAPSGLGTIYAITVNRRREGAHNVALVTLDEGVRMMTTIAGVETLPIGARVRAQVETGETPRIVFVPLGTVPQEAGA